MEKIRVVPLDTYRDWTQSNDVDILVIKPGEITEVTVTPMRFHVSEFIWDAAVAGATNADYGPYKISEPKVSEDKTSFIFVIDATVERPADEYLHHEKVFHSDYHSIAFSVGFGKLPRSLKHGEVDRKNTFVGFHITTRPLPEGGRTAPLELEIDG